MNEPDLRVIDADFANKPLQVHVVCGATWLWIDAGIADTPPRFLTSLAAEASTARNLLVITHADVDHFGGVAALREMVPNLVVMAPAHDCGLIRNQKAIFSERYEIHGQDGIQLTEDRRKQLRNRGGAPIAVDIELGARVIIDLGLGGRWEVLDVPGHTLGHIALYERRLQWLLIGDAALGWMVPGPDGRRLPPPYFDVARYRRTLSTLHNLPVSRVFTSHFGVLDEKAARRLWTDSAEAVSGIASAAWNALADGPASLRQIAHQVGLSLQRWPEEDSVGLVDPVSAHLREWIVQGLVRLDDAVPRRYLRS